MGFLPTRAAILAALAPLAACGEAPPPARPPLPVGVERVAAVDYGETVSLTGAVAARVTSDLSFRVGGRIVERKVEVGDHVDAGQVLARIDPAEQQASLAASEAGVRAAQAQLALATSTFERQKSLIDRGFTTRREYDQAQEGLTAGQGALDVAKAQLATDQDTLAQTVLKAPVAGIVTARDAEAGEVVQAAQTVYTLAQDGPRDAVFNVQEQLFIRDPDRREIAVALVADPAVTAKARIREVSPVVDASAGTVRVKLEILDPPPAMTLGAPVVGTGELGTRRAVLLPWTALSSQGGKPAVWLMDAGSKAVSLHPVGVLAYELGRVVVGAGLEDGQVVVARGQQLLRPGQVVLPVEERAP